MRFTDELVIAAPIEVVWDLTVDVEAWPSLTPTISNVELLDSGPIAVGRRARVTQPAQRPAVWTVTRLEPPATFAWERRVFKARMTGSHHLEATSEGTRNTLVLEVTGFGSGLIGFLAGRALRSAIHTENLGIRDRAQAIAAGG